MSYTTSDFPIDPFETTALPETSTVPGAIPGAVPVTGYRVVEPKDMFETAGLPSPWDDVPEKMKDTYRKRHINGLIAMAIYFIFVGIILVFMIGRYPADYVYWTILLISLIWVSGGAIFMWYIWLHGQAGVAIGLGALFVLVYGLLVYFVLERRYQDVYLAHPFMIRPVGF